MLKYQTIQNQRQQMQKQGFLYILFNKRNGTLYIGVTSNLQKRIYEHKNKLIQGFSCRYGINKLGYYEVFENIEEAIKREKQLKAGNRKTKLRLIETTNPNWFDLYETL